MNFSSIFSFLGSSDTNAAGVAAPDVVSQQAGGSKGFLGVLENEGSTLISNIVGKAAAAINQNPAAQQTIANITAASTKAGAQTFLNSPLFLAAAGALIVLLLVAVVRGK